VTLETDELWQQVAELIRSARGWSLRPLARLGHPREDRRTWLADGETGEVVVKLSANPFAPERAAWAGEALSLLRRRSMPVPEPLWSGRLNEQWFAVVQSRLPGEPVNTLDASLLNQLLGMVELQADPDLMPGGWDVSWWVGAVVFEGWEGWWEGAERASPQTTERLRALLEPAMGYRLPVEDVVHGDLNLSNVLAHDGVITGVVDWDHVGLGSRALDVASLLFDWHRLLLADETGLAADGGERLVRRIVEIAGQPGLRCTITYGAIARLALSAKREESDQIEVWRRVTDAIVDRIADQSP
jgi:Ser/Thr protein kinase RdoA (MazF antagonist)